MIWNNLQQRRNNLKEARNNLKPPKTSKKRLKQPITSKAQPKTIWTYQQQAKKDTKPPTTIRFWDYFTVLDNQFSSLTDLITIIQTWRIMVKIEHQTFVYYYMRLLWDMKFTGYIANYFDTCIFTFVRQKSILWITQKKSNFDIDKISGALKMIACRFHSIKLKNNWMLIILCLSNWIERFSNLSRLKFAFKFT